MCRLPLYLRALQLAAEEGRALVSSQDIAEAAGTNAAQVRKDLSHLGELGTRGLGYDVAALAAHITRELGVERERKVIIVGYGRLGGAMLNYISSFERGFAVVAVVDADPAKVGTEVAGMIVTPVAELEQAVRASGAEVAVVSTPPAVAQQVAERLCRAGIRAVLNFAPVSLELPCEARVRQVDLSAELQVLTYHLEHDGRRGA